MKWTLEVVKITFFIILISIILSFFNYITIGTILGQLTGGMILTLIVFSVESSVKIFKSLKN
jgi:hypothetical protein